jgi:proline iminopeptidase
MKKKWLYLALIAVLIIVGGVFAFRRMMEAGFYRVGDARKKADYSGAQATPERWLVDDGVALHHFSTGEGRDLLVVHGGPGFPPDAAWAISDELAPDFKLHYYHQRGCGKSSHPIQDPPEGNAYQKMTTAESLLGLAAQIHDIEEIRQLLGKDKLILVGHSFGALIAALYAAEYPQRVEALIFISPASLLVMPKEGPDLFALIESKLSGERLEQFRQYVAQIFDFGTLINRSDKELADFFGEFKKYYGWAAGSPNSDRMEVGPNTTGGWMTLAVYMSMGRRHDYTGPLKNVRAPVLVLHGADDLMPHSDSEAFAACFPNSRIEVIQNAGHFSFDDQPKEVAAAIRAFLSEKK